MKHVLLPWMRFNDRSNGVFLFPLTAQFHSCKCRQRLKWEILYLCVSLLISVPTPLLCSFSLCSKGRGTEALWQPPLPSAFAAEPAMACLLGMGNYAVTNQAVCMADAQTINVKHQDTNNLGKYSAPKRNMDRAHPGLELYQVFHVQLNVLE